MTTNDVRALTIKCPGGHLPSIASWRMRAVLQKGRYRFEGKLKAEDLAAMRNAPGGGVLIRVYGRGFAPSQNPSRNGEWQQLLCEFEVEKEGEEELICEVRAHKGRASFELDSLKIQHY